MRQRRADKSAIHTWLVLMKAHRTLTRHATRSIEALDMCLSDFAILEALLHKGPQPVRELGRRYGVEMPITEAVHAVLFENKDVLAALSELMSRDPKRERTDA